MADAANMQTPPQFSCLLFLRPRNLEKEFWASDVYKSWSIRLTTWSVTFMLLNNGFYFLLYITLPTGDLQLKGCISCVIWLAIAACQYSWMRRNSTHYQTWYNRILFCHRLARLLLFYDLVSSLQNEKITGQLQRHWSTDASRFLSPSLVAFRAAFIASLSQVSLTHGYVVPLPFTYQLLLHSLYLYILLAHHLPTAVALLELQPPGSTLVFKDLCHSLNVLATAAVGAVAGDTLVFSIGEDVCEQQAKPVLIAFLMTVLGTFLPIYVAFGLERYLKQLFLIDLCHQRGAGTAGPTLTAPRAGGTVEGDGDNRQQQQQQQQQQRHNHWPVHCWNETEMAPGRIRDLPALMQHLLVLAGATTLIWTGIICAFETSRLILQPV